MTPTEDPARPDPAEERETARPGAPAPGRAVSRTKTRGGA